MGSGRKVRGGEGFGAGVKICLIDYGRLIAYLRARCGCFYPRFRALMTSRLRISRARAGSIGCYNPSAVAVAAALSVRVFFALRGLFHNANARIGR